MSKNTRKRIIVIRSVSFFALLFFASTAVALSFQHSAYATSVPSDFTSFLNTQRNQPASSKQADDFYNLIGNHPFSTVCAKSGSYFSGAVNKMDGGEAFISLITWLDKGSSEDTSVWRDKSNRLIFLLSGEIGSGMKLEYDATNNNSEGWCSFIVKSAIAANIPVSGKAVVVNNETESKSININKIGDSCSAAFADASNNFVGVPSEVTSFLNGLDDATYKSLVRPYELKIAGTGAGSSECTKLTDGLSSLLKSFASDYCKNNPDDSKKCSSPEIANDNSSCQIDGIGWLVCPVLTFLGTLADGMYNAIAGMLTVDNDLVSVNGKTSDTVSTTYSAWGTMRNIANVAFVIVFLIIIFSQLTNMVVSNYGVKKLLPRLIIAAILVNLSYTVCQLAVDISNILGWSLRDVFTALAPAADVTKTTGDASGNFGGWAAIVAIIIGGAGIAFAALSALIPILLAALIGLVVVFLILLLRKALIVILIIISPLAFVAFLLPNTEQWFKKWFKAFGSMLMVFPIVAVVFGASALAADIIKAAGDNNASGDANPWMQLIAMGVAAAPLMIVPGILKKSIDGVGNVGAAINKFGAKAGSGLGKLGAKGFENTALSRGRASRKQGRQIYRDQKFARAMTRGGIRAKAARGPSITGAQKFANQALTRSAYAASDKADQEAETAAEMMITKRAMLTDSERQTVAKGGSVTKNGVQIDGSDRAYRRAAIKIQASGKHDHIKELVDRGMTGEDAQLLAASIGASPNKPIWAGQGALQEIAQGTGKKTSELIESAVKADAYSSEKIATGDKDELAEVYATVTSSSSTLSSGERVKLRDNATAVDMNPELKAKVAKNRAEVSSLQTI
ncbi:MAG TPA: hypothetical protein PLZ58_01140 [Candidatus Saccharibacteria bacterium]|nr:hypothetical protein [Candidatus Saccharibacteria bacterium]HRQ07074.1 hypothetical protein [Candidatus Saccharibacteria bacterium]